MEERKKWRVQIGHGGKLQHLGYFEDIQLARNTYDKKAKELFGEFAYLNRPQSEARIREML